MTHRSEQRRLSLFWVGSTMHDTPVEGKNKG